MKVLVNNLMVSITKDQDDELIKALVKKGIKRDNILSVSYLKRSIDSRKKNDIKFVYNLEVDLKDDIKTSEKNQIFKVKEEKTIKRIALEKGKEVIVIGTGPAGLFATLRLCQLGYKPLVFERGSMVSERDKDIERFYKLDLLNEDSNIQFGEGGAGTYSDGKLNTRIKSGYINEVFLELTSNGAQEQILWDYKPHIGTDILKEVVVNLRKKLIHMGAKFHFNTRVEEVKVKDGSIEGIFILHPNGNKEFIKNNTVILGCGHSARDTYRMLNRNGVFMENKPFAIGARIEHPRRDIDKMQYGKYADHPNLEAATYNLTFNNRSEERGIFSFCMCPGGEIVNATSSKGTSLVNGMSYSTRDGEFSNSALAVGVKANEFGEHLFSGMELQELIEKRAYESVENYGGVYQSVYDFLKDKPTKHEIKSSYQMRLHSDKLTNILPEVITDNMKLALNYWSKNKYFVSSKANLVGPETRTSAPVRITRNENFESINTKGLYPIGEGAGYAGGIVSAAVDGLRAIDTAFSKVID